MLAAITSVGEIFYASYGRYGGHTRYSRNLYTSRVDVRVGFGVFCETEMTILRSEVSFLHAFLRGAYYTFGQVRF